MKILELPDEVFDQLVRYAREHDLTEVEAAQVAVSRLAEPPEEDEELDEEEVAELREALAAYRDGEPTLKAEDVQEHLNLPRLFPVRG